MPPVAVVTDSTPYLPREMVAAHELHEVSLYVVAEGGATQRESEIADYTAFYDELRAARSLPTTSQPSIGDFLAAYEPLAEAGRDIVSIHLSGGISGTVDSARQAAAQLTERFPDRSAAVVDSRLACGALAASVLAAAAMAESGAGVDAVAERARAAAAEMKLWFAVDTLEFLRRGGRIGGAQAWLGGALKIKPLLSFEDGMLEPVERVRTSSRAIARLLDFLRMRVQDGADAWIVQHVQAPEQAARLVEAGREVTGTDPVFVSEIGPVIGAHSGPGLLGIGGLPAELLRA